MQVTVEAPSKIERKMTIVVPSQSIDAAFDKEIAHLAKTVKVDGFRQGKVPVDFIKKQYGKAAHQEALSQVIQTSFTEALKQEKLNPVGQPLVHPKTIIPGQPIEFTATFEVIPQIDSVHFQLSALEKLVATVEETDIDLVIDRMRTQYAQWKKVDRAAQDQDKVALDFSGAIDGKLFEGGKADNYSIILGSKSMIPGFEEGMIGMKAGETKVVPVTFPQNYFAKEVAGKTAEFTIHMRTVLEPELPSIDENFAKKLGIKSGNLDELRTEIRKNLKKELQQTIQGKLKSSVFKTLLDQNALEVPKALIEQEAAYIHDQMHPDHKGHAHQHSAEENAAFLEMAKKNIMVGLLMSALVKQYGLTTDEQRVKEFIEMLVSSYEDAAQMTKWYHDNKQAMAQIRTQVLEDQVIEKLLESVKVTEKSVSYAEMMKQ